MATSTWPHRPLRWSAKHEYAGPNIRICAEAADPAIDRGPHPSAGARAAACPAKFTPAARACDDNTLARHDRICSWDEFGGPSV